MAASEPWITLGRNYEECLESCRHPEYMLLVARREGERCGFVLLHPRGVAGSPYMKSIGVTPELRNQGIGEALVHKAEAFYPGARHMFLCVSSFNLDAQNFYERLGYQMVGILADYIVDGESEILLHKRLPHQ